MSNCFIRLTPILLLVVVVSGIISGCNSIPPGGSGNNGTIATAVDVYILAVATLAFHKVVIEVVLEEEEEEEDDDDDDRNNSNGDTPNAVTILSSVGVVNTRVSSS